MSVTHARGYRAAGVACGLKESGEPDLALVVADGAATAAGVFTRNRVLAAPVLLARRNVDRGQARALLTNSGNANACTGAQGDRDAARMAASAAAALGLDPAEVLVSSTGVIGRPLAMDRVEAGIAAAAAALTTAGGAAAAEAIRTTDAYPKLASRTLELDGREVRIGGMAKGAGMIRPDMATTLAQVTTDAAIQPELLQALLREACDASFNRITVDGSTSTNDCILVLANGAAGARAAGPGADALGAALADVLLDLALQVVADGEGTSRYCRWHVTGARDAADAQAAARTVAEDTLVRCALHGADPNWGRILAALGRAGIELDPARVAIAAGGVPLVERGEGVDGTEQQARAALAQPAAEVDIDLGLGEASASVYGSALSPEYVRLNAEYTT